MTHQPTVRMLLAALLLSCPAQAVVIDRVLAVVDGRPLLLSERAALAQVKQLDDTAALEALIDAHLMFREAARLAQATVSDDDEARALAGLRGRDAAARVPEPELRRLARRELAILRYVEFRFRPQVRLSDEDLLQAYEREYGSRPGAVPAFADVAEELRRTLTERELDARIEAWVKELRGSAEVRYNDGGGPPSP